MRRYTVGTRNYEGYVEYVVLDHTPGYYSPGAAELATFSLKSDAEALADRLEACRSDTRTNV